MIRVTRYFATALFLGFAAALPAAPTVLLQLEHVEAGKPLATKIEAKTGVVESKDKGKPRDRWIIRTGDIVSGVSRPTERKVNFFQIAGGNSILLFIVNVRYFPTADGRWAPQYQLNEEPLVVRGPNGRWQPLTILQGVPHLIVQTGSTLPNAEGYLNTLEFGFTTGPASIDAWQVQ